MPQIVTKLYVWRIEKGARGRTLRESARQSWDNSCFSRDRLQPDTRAKRTANTRFREDRRLTMYSDRYRTFK